MDPERIPRPKFIQIELGMGGMMFALDEDGRVWLHQGRKFLENNTYSEAYWEPFTSKRKTARDTSSE